MGLQNQRVPCWMTALITGHLHFVEYFELLLEDGLTGHEHKLVYGLVCIRHICPIFHVQSYMKIISNIFVHRYVNS